MPKRDKLLNELQGENDLCAFLLAQAGGVPNELQLMVQTVVYDPEAKGLRQRGSYIIRALGTLEYRIDNLGGTVDTVDFVSEHPLLYPYNTTPAAVFFRGQPDDVNELIIDISQAHASTFAGWRHFPEYLNLGQPLVTLLTSGGGLVGQMPMPLAERIVSALERHGLETKVMEGEREAEEAHPGFSNTPQVMTIGSSYFVAYAFSVDELGKV